MLCLAVRIPPPLWSVSVSALAPLFCWPLSRPPQVWLLLRYPHSQEGLTLVQAPSVPPSLPLLGSCLLASPVLLIQISSTFRVSALRSLSLPPAHLPFFIPCCFLCLYFSFSPSLFPSIPFSVPSTLPLLSSLSLSLSLSYFLFNLHFLLPAPLPCFVPFTLFLHLPAVSASRRLCLCPLSVSPLCPFPPPPLSLSLSRLPVSFL